MSKKLKKVVLALALVSGFAVFTASPSEASIYEMDPGPAIKPASVGKFTLEQ